MALPPIFDPLVNAPRSQKLVVGVLGAIVIIAAAYFLLLAPARDEVAQLRAQLSSLQTEITRNRATVADLLKYRREAAELEARLNALKDRLPGEKEIPTLYRAVSDAATAPAPGRSLLPPPARTAAPPPSPPGARPRPGGGPGPRALPAAPAGRPRLLQRDPDLAERG